jgi:hypothetical protein
MRTQSSKHGLERKFKPWRKGKSSSKKKARVDGEDGDGRHRNLNNKASLKNMLRSQRRLLGRLQKSGDVDDVGANKTINEEAINGVRQKIHMLEEGIAAHEAIEREKKNATK